MPDHHNEDSAMQTDHHHFPTSPDAAALRALMETLTDLAEDSVTIDELTTALRMTDDLPVRCRLDVHPYDRGVYAEIHGPAGLGIPVYEIDIRINTGQRCFQVLGGFADDIRGLRLTLIVGRDLLDITSVIDAVKADMDDRLAEWGLMASPRDGRSTDLAQAL